MGQVTYCDHCHTKLEYGKYRFYGELPFNTLYRHKGQIAWLCIPCNDQLTKEEQ